MANKNGSASGHIGVKFGSIYATSAALGVEAAQIGVLESSSGTTPPAAYTPTPPLPEPHLSLIVGGGLSTLDFFATGGTKLVDGAYTVHVFSASGSLVCSGEKTAEVLVIGGGGGGSAGGGGAGGYLAGTETLSGTMSVTVGAGGAGRDSSVAAGLSGADSVFGTRTAAGGGGGGAADVSNGGAGGSGGGVGESSIARTGGAASPSGQGNAGGGTGTFFNVDPYPAGGGGGAGAAGHDNASNTVGGAGGAGLSSDIVTSGINVDYAGGGGGGCYFSTGGGTGGGASHGGGAGQAGQAAGTAGTPNTGGGGGGTGYSDAPHTNPSYYGGAGGSGIVVIRYATGPTIWSAADDITRIATNISHIDGEHGPTALSFDIPTEYPLLVDGLSNELARDSLVRLWDRGTCLFTGYVVNMTRHATHEGVVSVDCAGDFERLKHDESYGKIWSDADLSQWRLCPAATNSAYWTDNSQFVETGCNLGNTAPANGLNRMMYYLYEGVVPTDRIMEMTFSGGHSVDGATWHCQLEAASGGVDDGWSGATWTPSAVTTYHNVSPGSFSNITEDAIFGVGRAAAILCYTGTTIAAAAEKYIRLTSVRVRTQCIADKPITVDSCMADVVAENLVQQPSPVGAVWPGWWHNSGGTWTADTSRFKGVAAVGNPAQAIYIGSVPQAGARVKPGASYLFSAYVDADTPSATHLWAEWINASKSIISTDALTPTSTGRVLVSGMLTAPATAASVQLCLVLDNGSYTAYFDTVSFTQLIAAAPITVTRTTVGSALDHAACRYPTTRAQALADLAQLQRTEYKFTKPLNPGDNIGFTVRPFPTTPDKRRRTFVVNSTEADIEVDWWDDATPDYICVTAGILSDAGGKPDGSLVQCFRPTNPPHIYDRVIQLDLSGDMMTLTQMQAAGDSELAYQQQNVARGTVTIEGQIRTIDGVFTPATWVQAGDWLQIDGDMDKNAQQRPPQYITQVEADDMAQSAVITLGYPDLPDVQIAKKAKSWAINKHTDAVRRKRLALAAAKRNRKQKRKAT